MAQLSFNQYLYKNLLMTVLVISPTFHRSFRPKCAPAVMSVVADETSVMMAVIGSTLPQIQSGDVVPLAIVDHRTYGLSHRRMFRRYPKPESC